ncbi:hypothetical protein JTE90_016578 [Oedothorax gibbosus]|uniref:TGF-beta family profile domain-containing protein n=1 Tax=Oedothorax gibbosus TaxID=931172 RepID=A0AAV6UBT0_9ARAC|nr:hypothetical protein JTE90_016578 [Oedothorax gibbosus]
MFRLSRWFLLVWSQVLFFSVSLLAGPHNHPHQHLSEDVPYDEDDVSYEDVVGGNCTRCGERGERRAMRLDMIKFQILSQLGLKEAPNVTSRQLPHIPPLDSLLDHYTMQGDAVPFVPGPEYGDDDDFYIAAEKVLTFAQTPPGSKPIEIASGDQQVATGSKPIEIASGDQQLFFQLPSNLQQSQIQSSHLWIHIRPTRRVLHLNMTLYQVEKQPSGEIDFIQVKRKSIEKKNKHGHWVVFDVKKTVSHWLKHPSENLGFILHASGLDIADLLRISEENGQGKKPFIETKVEKQRHRRTKRMIGLNCEENADEVRCCRYPLTVDFEEFGWDWIIAPKRYEANYCSGECPYVFLQKYPHTHLVQQANPQGSAGPCCAPRKMSSISMLYFDSDFNIIYGMLPGMVVDRCGCS